MRLELCATYGVGCARGGARRGQRSAGAAALPARRRPRGHPPRGLAGGATLAGGGADATPRAFGSAAPRGRRRRARAGGPDGGSAGAALRAYATLFEQFGRLPEARGAAGPVVGRSSRRAIGQPLCDGTRLAATPELGAHWLELLHRAAIFCATPYRPPRRPRHRLHLAAAANPPPAVRRFDRRASSSHASPPPPTTPSSSRHPRDARGEPALIAALVAAVAALRAARAPPTRVADALRT